VSYYEPAGTDATIYGPHPDYRFINDTGNHILIQTHIEGDELVYEFWGTKDGRIATQTTPVVYNITSPPPTKYIETLDLSVGKVKCTERAHKGADTSFDYSVAYPDGGVRDVTFNSHYRAWQEVCLIGVEKLTEPEELKTSETNELENSLN
jgi:vancomycin resistance protein YoaR